MFKSLKGFVLFAASMAAAPSSQASPFYFDSYGSDSYSVFYSGFIMTSLDFIALSPPPVYLSSYKEEFFDDFTGNTPSNELNYSNWDGWSVSGGTVDKIKSGGFGITCETTVCVDLDGSTRASGLFRTSSLTNLKKGVDYVLTARMSGNQRNASQTDTVTFGFLNSDLSELGSETVLFGGDLPYDDYTLDFTPKDDTPAYLFFQNQGGDNLGVVLDSVLLESTQVVPLPGTLPLMLAGIGGFSLIRRRRKARV